MESEADVQALRREVELLKTLLHQERKKSSATNHLLSNSTMKNARSASSEVLRSVSPVEPVPMDHFSRGSVRPSTSQDDDAEKHNDDQSPRQDIATGSTSVRDKGMRWNTNSPQQAHTPTPDQHQNHQQQQRQWNVAYLQHVPVDTKRGKWWLKDREILSRNVPSPYDGCIAMKVRETWLWSGRAVVVDKIITCPNTISVHDEVASEDEEESNRGDHGLESHGNTRMMSILSSLATGDPSPRNAAPGSAAHSSDSKRLAQEYIQPKAATENSVEESSELLHTASARMEQQMSKAAEEQQQ